MDKPKIKAVIFDMGNVLIDFDHKIAARRIAMFSEKSAEEIFDMFFDSELTGRFEEGKISSSEFFLKVKEILNLKLDYNDFLPIWNEIFFLSQKNRLVYSLACNLKLDYKIALLTNINILHFDYVKKNFPVFNAFHYIITSFELGLRKPHPLVYSKVIQMLELAPSAIFYIDDRPELTWSAKQLGIQGFVFKGIEQLKKDLFNAGVYVS